MGIGFLVGLALALLVGGLLGRMLALCGLSPTGQEKRSRVVRAHGPFTLAMTAVGTAGHPCWKLPHLLLTRAFTEAMCTGRCGPVRGKRRRDFMGRLGINNDGGVPGRLRDLMERLFGCAMTLHYRGNDKSVCLARAAPHDRARAAHPPPRARADPPRAKAGRLRFSLASHVSTALLRLSQGDRWPSSLPKSLSRAILRSCLWLPPAARLALEPLGRRKPAARTLTLAQRGVCHCLAHAALAQHCTWLRFVLPLSGLAVAAGPG